MKRHSLALLIWTGNKLSRQGNEALRLFKSTRDNPQPDAELVSIDFRSAMTECAPFLIAITVE